MSAEDNKRINRQFYERVFNQHNLDAIPEYIGKSYTGHSFPPGLPPGPEGLKVFLSVFFSAFPDGKVTVEDILAEGDRVAARAVFSGTHQGDFQGIPATGKKVAVPAIDLARFEDGKLVEHWGGPDLMSLMVQLGAIPAPG